MRISLIPVALALALSGCGAADAPESDVLATHLSNDDTCVSGLCVGSVIGKGDVQQTLGLNNHAFQYWLSAHIDTSKAVDHKDYLPIQFKYEKEFMAEWVCEKDSDKTKTKKASHEIEILELFVSEARLKKQFVGFTITGITKEKEKEKEKGCDDGYTEIEGSYKLLVDQGGLQMKVTRPAPGINWQYLPGWSYDNVPPESD
jgi:hypothetical protein